MYIHTYIHTYFSYTDIHLCITLANLEKLQCGSVSLTSSDQNMDKFGKANELKVVLRTNVWIRYGCLYLQLLHFMFYDTASLRCVN